jgi:nucleoid-associated protein YgaU
LAIRYLGSRHRLQNLKDANQQLRNFNHIYPGQKVYLPDLAERE